MNDFQEKIKERAYALYLERGSKPGHAMEDWIRAEKEINGRYSSQGRAEGATQTAAKASKQPQREAAPRQEQKAMKKNGKPQEALLFSSGKQNVRSAVK